MVVLLLAARVQDLTLGPEAVSRLTSMGVTYAALLSDEEGVAVVLDGVRFDPTASARAALTAIGAASVTRTLRPLAQMSVGGT